MKKFTLTFFLLFIVCAQAHALDREYLSWINKKPVIDSIIIEGNEHFKDKEVQSRMYALPRNPWRALKGERRSRLQRETLGRDTMEVKYLYLTNGFLGVSLSERFEKIGEGDAPPAKIIVNIHEGTQFFYGETVLNGTYESKFSWPLTKQMRKLKEGKPINLFEVRQVVFDMKTVMANDGYPYAVVKFNIDTINTRERSQIVFNVQSDSLVYFGRTQISGISNFPSKVASRELTFKEGDVYKRQKIIDSQRRLYESGYFSLAQINQSQSSFDRLRPDFTLRVRERKPYFASVTTGAGQSEVKDLQWDLSLGWGKRNFSPNFMNKFYGSQHLGLNADYSISLGSDSRLITHRYQAKYTIPWILGIRMPITLTGEYEPPLRSKYQNYTIRSWALSASTIKKFGEEVRMTTGIEYNNVRITDFATGDPELIRLEEGISIQRKIYLTYRRDSRDNIFIPRRGSVTDMSVEYYGGFLGGDDNFLKTEASWSTYQIVWPGWIGAVRIKGGRVKEFSNSNPVPTEERFYLGGANTVRGFEENDLGPIQVDPVTFDTTAAGGNYELIANVEFRWKTLQILNPIAGFFKRFPLWQSVFVDAGNSFSRIENISIDRMAFSYGTGVQIISPAGPIRVDYARRIKTERYDVASRWHFTILYAF